MPLIRIERRAKAPAAAPAVDSAATPRRAPARAPGSPLPALLAGAVAALLVLGAVAFVLVRRSASSPPAATGAPVAPAAAAAVAGPAVGFADFPLDGVPPLDEVYPREAVLATVGGVPITMAQLEVRVRVARTLGTLAGDAVPSYGDAGAMRRFEVQLLRRAVDVVLIQLAARDAGVSVPEGVAGGAVEQFLGQVNAAPSQLDDALVANGVTRPMLDAWFANAALVDFFLQTEVLPDPAGEAALDPADPAAREAAIKAWLDQQWAGREIVIQFYDPDEL